MIKLGVATALLFWMSLTLATHPQYLQTAIVSLAVVGPIIFIAIYIRTLGLLAKDIWRFLRIRLFVWQAKKDKSQQGSMPSES